MICHIIQNGGCMFFILFLCMIVSDCSVQEHSFTVQEFCSGNLFIHNIEPEEPYVLILRSEKSTSLSKVYYKYHKRKCRQEFKTSDSAAHFEILISRMNLSSSCVNCGCNYFEISDLGHNKRFCGQREEAYFASKSDKVFIDFHPGLSMQFDVTLTFTVTRNFYVVTGSIDASVPVNYIETPYFPVEYPPNYRVDYILRSGSDLYVVLLFLDFLVSHQSFIEVTGNNGTHSTRFYGNVFRPPVIVSQSNTLNLKFESNDQRGWPGFRAELRFLKSIEHLFVPYTDCGGPQTGRDGYLNVKTHKNFGLYDCVWLIMPTQFMPTKLYRSILVHLRNIGHKSNLEFRSGRHSKSDIVKMIGCDNENCTYTDAEIVVQAGDHLYIRFSGYLEAYSVVNMSYSTYHMGNCSNKEFRCSNGRCLLSDLRCDGVKQCPDGMDEDMCPLHEVSEDQVTYPPTAHTESHLNDAMHLNFSIILSVGSFGLFIVVVVIFIVIRNHCRQINAVNPVMPQQVTGELSDIQSSLYSGNSSDYDRPPSYEDFVKSSNNYPPLLYTRANQRYVPPTNCTQCTTSFCSGARARHYSADSFNVRRSENDNDIFLNITEDESHPTQSQQRHSQFNIEVNQNLTFKVSNSGIKKSYSLDSKLNELMPKHSCNLFLSIIHPVCAHVSSTESRVECHTLPPNFKINTFKTSSNNGQSQKANFVRDRRCTWSFVPPRSVGTEIVTIVKTRCFSDPCNGIRVHCSLY